MDVRLPDGTVVQNVPDDISRDQLTAKLKANGYDVSKLEPATPDATAGERTKAAIGGVNRGISGLLGLPIDTAENIINLGIAAYGKATGTTPDLILNTPGGSQSIANMMERVLGSGAASNVRPDDPASQMLYRAGTVAGGSMVPGAGVGRTAASAGGAAVAEQALGPEYAGVGALAPAAATQAAVAAKNAVAARVAPQMEAFKEVGAQPSVGQATKANFIQGFENLLSKFPGGQGVFRKFVENQQAKLAENTRTGVSAEDAGRTIESGVKGFIGRTKDKWLELDNELATKVPQGYAVEPTNTHAALAGLTAPVKGAEATTGALVNPKMAAIRDNLAKDLQANNGQIPFHALRDLRSRVGAMLDDSLITGIPGGELKRLYGALSKDMEAAANAAGAGKEFARQNNFYAARSDRLDMLEKVIGKTPEDTFRNFMPKDPEAVTKVRQVMRSLTESERETVTDAVVNRLGRALPGKQDMTGEMFSTETFLTNWNKMSPGAKAQIFPDAAMRKNLDALANVSDDIRAGAKVFANPSGTAGATAPYGIGYLAASGAWDFVTGNVPGAVAKLGTAGSLLGGAYIGSKMLTSPKTVEWLARSSKVSTPEQATAQLGRLGVIYNETKDEQLKQELGAYLKSIQGNNASPQADRGPGMTGPRG